MLCDPDQERDFQRFLCRVEEISNLVQGLSSADPAVKEKALAAAEEKLHEQEASREEASRVAVDRTVINTRPSDAAGAVDAEAFLAALEKDAKERAQQRKRNELLAKALQEKGNEAFRKGDYATAVQRYTAGLEKLRDKQELYTNRAQAYLRMHEYEKAIADCEWALKCNGKCAKAFFLMGKAHLALQHYSQSRQCYEQLLQADPQRQSLFEDCVNEVNLEEKRLKAEERAKEEAESGSLAALAIKELLQNLHRPGQSILYYAGGIRLLAGAVTGCTEQTFFRTNNGFSLLRANEAVRRGFCAERRGSAELELSVSLLLLWQAVCTGNEANQHLLLSDPDVNAQLPKLLSSGVAEIQQQTLALLSLYSGNETGRRLLGKHLDLSNWLQALMSCVPYSDTRAGSAMDILSELAAGARFRSQAGALLPSGVLPLFTQLLASAKLVNQAALARCVGSLGTLCAAVGIRVQLAESRQCWQACLQLLDQYLSNPSLSQECVCAVLGLMMNLLLESNLLIQAGGELSSSYALRTLCICTRSSRQAQEDLVRADRGLRLLLELLASEDEVAVGNAALCLGQCLAVPGAASSLLGSGAVPALLRLAGGDAAPASVQRNSALALGRLCLAEPRHLLQLRQLNGLAILHSCLKHLQSS
ncbi:tetratricopeptide repeat protein 12 isoform X3 [Melanerpes formicivorus]|uniref:tetratricopeptide repeat protein 12 isoform X3 n=1 Tax=Melanerpes formicivorus TaxID=211600 RepID=UPI00358FD0F7